MYFEINKLKRNLFWDNFEKYHGKEHFSGLSLEKTF